MKKNLFFVSFLTLLLAGGCTSTPRHTVSPVPIYISTNYTVAQPPVRLDVANKGRQWKRFVRESNQSRLDSNLRMSEIEYLAAEQKRAKELGVQYGPPPQPAPQTTQGKVSPSGYGTGGGNRYDWAPSPQYRYRVGGSSYSIAPSPTYGYGSGTSGGAVVPSPGYQQGGSGGGGSVVPSPNYQQGGSGGGSVVPSPGYQQGGSGGGAVVPSPRYRQRSSNGGRSSVFGFLSVFGLNAENSDQGGGYQIQGTFAAGAWGNLGGRQSGGDWRDGKLFGVPFQKSSPGYKDTGGRAVSFVTTHSRGGQVVGVGGFTSGLASSPSYR